MPRLVRPAHRSTPWLAIVPCWLGVAGCSGSSTPAATTDAGSDASSGASGACADAGDLPNSLACTGLYTDIVGKTVASTASPYAPAIPLWADGSGKLRWVQFPPGATIDRSSPNDWVFPVGTKFWKEFSRGGKRIETRFFYKQSSTAWLDTTYVWNADESDAIASPGASIPLADGTTYVVPTPSQCLDCHGGRNEPVMGFEEVSLGTAGATGQTLAQLAASGLLTPAPTRTALVIGDDGTGQAAAPLAWMHINCGVSCHNANPKAYGSASGLLLRLDATQLDGRSPIGFDSITTTEGVAATSPAWSGQYRIVPGDPTDSLLLHLVSTRAPGDEMPPIASLLVDAPDTTAIAAWITAMPSTSSDAGVDATIDADESGVADAGVESSVDATSSADAAPDSMPDSTLDSMPDAASDADESGDDATDDSTVDAMGDDSTTDAGDETGAASDANGAETASTGD